MTTRRRITADGYVEATATGGRPGRVREHRAVVAKAIGRPLTRAEVVHHVNRDRADNRPQNLMLFANSVAHLNFHKGKPSQAIWDGRKGDIEKPAGQNAGSKGEMRCRVLRTGTIQWRKLRWFQGDLKQVTASDMAHLKAALIETGLSSPFSVWAEKPDTTWILDGHQRRLAMAELETEGYKIADKLPAVWLDCQNRAEAACFVLLLASRYGKMKEEPLTAFLAEMGADLGSLANIVLPDLDVEGMIDGAAREANAANTIGKLADDLAPAPAVRVFRIEEATLAPRVIAWLNRERIVFKEVVPKQ